MAQVQRGIDQLTPAQREVVWLRYRHDLDYKEIAKILGVSENACRLRVHKSMGLLRERLGRQRSTSALIPGTTLSPASFLALSRTVRGRFSDYL